jgi:diaminopimelate epimerase
MIIRFSKYHGAGNDFILIDNRSRIIRNYKESEQLVAFLCNRRLGVGADGLMLINSHTEYDFEMVYFNSDGKEGSMCGNGGRCIVAFALSLGVIKDKTNFIAVDGLHEAQILNENPGLAVVRLKMADVSEFKKVNDHYEVNTGSPHYIAFVDNPENTDVVALGRKIRYSKEFPDGTNVNFVSVNDESIYVRTFERGVEDETLSCGTGVTASAIAAFLQGDFPSGSVDIKTRGGELHVDFEKEEGLFRNIWLTGPASFVFKGEIVI